MKLSFTLLATTVKSAPDRNTAPIGNIDEMALVILDGSGKNGFTANDANDYGCAGRGLFDPFSPTKGKPVDATDKAFYKWKKCIQCAVANKRAAHVLDYNYDEKADSCANSTFKSRAICECDRTLVTALYNASKININFNEANCAHGVQAETACCNWNTYNYASYNVNAKCCDINAGVKDIGTCTSSTHTLTATIPSTQSTTTMSEITTKITTLTTSASTAATTVPTTAATTIVSTSNMTTTKTEATTQTTTAATFNSSTQAGSTCTNFPTPGELTVYSANPEGGNCDFPWSFIQQHSKAYTHFVALPSVLPDANAYDNHMSCGRCVRFKCNCAEEQSLFDFACENAQGHEVIAMVVNSCPSCHIFGDLDLSNAAWDEVTGNQTHSRFDGSYEFVPCPAEFLEPSGTRLRFKEIFNHANGIARVEYKLSDGILRDADFPDQNDNFVSSFMFRLGSNLLHKFPMGSLYKPINQPDRVCQLVEGCDCIGTQCYVGLEICAYNVNGDKGCLTMDQILVDNFFPEQVFTLDSNL